MTTLEGIATPVGSLVGGAVAAVVGPVAILGALGVANFVATAYVLVSGPLRSLPPVADIERGDDRIERFAD
jgi:hypothetical protein